MQLKSLENFHVIFFEKSENQIPQSRSITEVKHFTSFLYGKFDFH